MASYWGGTEIETWQPNSSITNCVNSTGGAIINRAQGNGALFNGMIAPFVNTTIKGALWYGCRKDFVLLVSHLKPTFSKRFEHLSMVMGFIYIFIFIFILFGRYQGENNVYECADGYGVAACGSPTNGSGYACQLANMITQWRQVRTIHLNPLLFLYRLCFLFRPYTTYTVVHVAQCEACAFLLLFGIFVSHLVLHFFSGP